MPDHTPADKPDLPALPLRFEGETYITRHLIQQFAWGAADEREAWARADERRKARAELIADIQSAVNHMGCPPGLPPRGAEYFKAGARRAIDAMNSAIDKE